MTNEHANSSRKPLRLWPGVALAAGIILAKILVRVYPSAFGADMLAPLAGTLLIVIWWLLFSRAPWTERVGALLVAIAATFAIRPFLHESMPPGLIGMMFVLFAVPLPGPALVAWAAFSRRLPPAFRWASLVATMVLACGAWTLVRTEGITGSGGVQLSWRWTKSSEEKLLAAGSAAAEPAPEAPAPSEPDVQRVEGSEPARARPAGSPRHRSQAEAAEPDQSRVEWAGFRGTDRDGVVHGLRIETDWTKAPPVEIWRRPIGPGWSSFAVNGDLFYTQEQRGQDEIVAGYRLSSGKPAWSHRDPVRFWEAGSGAGPRGTPTVSAGRVFAFGATGILNVLDARSGKRLWSRNVASDTGRRVPDWGFSSSPLVIDDEVIVAASGTLAAYDTSNGTRRWIGPRKLGTYSSPHRVRIGGAEQILLLSGSGATSVAPSTGDVQWEHEWQEGGATIVQPAVTADGDVLIPAMTVPGGAGIRRVNVTYGSDRWTVTERWTSTGLKPHFNDYVIHQGHAYGFDGSILACIDLQDGARKWKGGRYGNGQMLLLADQDVLLVISEEGELALIGAVPDQFRELARFKAIEGKTWNHPALAGDVLLVRNGEEMAAFRLPRAAR
jgi:outer membrane protein assembly factor BamB